MGVTTYNPKKCQVIVGGVPMSHFADGTFVEVEKDEDDYSYSSGADGEPSRTRNHNPFATMTLTLKQTSPSNAILTGLREADEQADAGIVPVLIREAENLLFSGESWVNKPPTVSYATEEGDREWTLILTKPKFVVMGNLI